MQLLNIRLSANNESKFIVNARSDAGQAESGSSLPFYETKTMWRTALIKILDISKFSSDQFSDEEKLWMKREGLLLSDGSGFSADYLEKIGQSLYKSLFPVGEVSDLLQRSIALAEKDHNPQLHIQIEFSAGVTELNRLPDYPWEMVHDGQRFLAHHNVTFSRYIANLSAPPTLSSVSRINVLLVSSGASDKENKLDPLSKNEHEAVKKGLKKSQEDKHIHLSEPKQASFKELTTYLTEHRGDDAPHVLHFDGHGVFGKRCLNSECRTFQGNSKLEKCKKCGTALSASQGYLLFEPDENDDDLEANYVSAEEIGSLLQSIRHGDSHAQQGGVRLAVLSACRSAYALGGSSVFNGVAQNLIWHGVPAVVAMQYKVSTKGATAFAERFYRELGNKQSLAVATSQGRVAMQNVEHNQWYRLIFYLRWQANDGGQLFATVRDNSPKSQATKTISIPSNVRQGSKNFVGREEKLAEIHATLQNGQGVIVCALEGMGGVGKTELALQYATRYQQEYVAQYWFSLRSGELAEEVVKLAGNLIPESMKSARPDEQAAWCWQNWLPETGKLLVILDDVTKAESIPDTAMPINPRVRVLVTTRERELNVGFKSVPLDVLPEEKALELLRKIVGAAKVDKELVTVKEICCNTLGYLPLGIELIGEYLSKNRFLTFAKLQERVNLADESISRDRKHKLYAHRGVEAAIQLSWEDISNGSQRVAMLLGLFAPVEILWELVAEIGASAEITEAEINEARGQLDSLHLIQPIDEECNFYKIHALVCEFFRAKLLKAEENHQFRQAFVTSLLAKAKEIPQSPTRDLIARLAPVIPHLDILSREMLCDILNPEKDENLVCLFEGIANFYSGKCLYTLAIEVYQKCSQEVKIRFGENSRSFVVSINNLAEIYKQYQRYNESEQNFLKALEIAKKGLHYDLVPIISNNLANVYQLQSKYNEVEELYLCAAKSIKENLGDRNIELATIYDNLSHFYYSQKKLCKADKYCRVSYSIREDLPKENDSYIAIAVSLNRIGLICHEKGEHEKAERCYIKALQIREQYLPENHEYIAESLNNLGELYKDQKKYNEAEEKFLKVIEIDRIIYGENHCQFAKSINKLADLYYLQGRCKEAKLLLDRHTATLIGIAPS